MVRITVARKIRIHDGDDDKEESMPPYIVAVRGLQARGILGPTVRNCCQSLGRLLLASEGDGLDEALATNGLVLVKREPV